MQLDTIFNLVHQALFLFLLLTAPPLLAVLAVGWVAATLASMTQTHDPVVTFVPKVVAAVVSLLLVSPWIWAELVRFTQTLWTDFIP